MKKKVVLLCCIVILTLGLVGCGNSNVKKSIEKAITLMENKEYDKSILSLELALDEDGNNTEAKILLDIVQAYLDSKKNYEENNIIESKNIVDSINSEYEKYPIKVDIIELKTKIDENYKEIEKINSFLIEAKRLFDEGKYVDCKFYLSNNVLGSEHDDVAANPYTTDEQNNKAVELYKSCEEELAKVEDSKPVVTSKKEDYLNKLDMIEISLSELEYLYQSGVTSDINEAEGRKLKKWDDMLNEIYGLLKVQLSTAEMEDLTIKQVNWISYRDKTAENESSQFEGGSMAGVQYNSTLARLTKERCYELVNVYMK